MQDWEKTFIADMRAIGLLRDDQCLGCGKFDCGGCPAGTASAVDHSKLSPDASVALKEIFKKRRGGT